jgi:PTS system nitrogen regulatory IIA component
MRLQDVLSADDITTELLAVDKEATLRELAQLLSRGETPLDADEVYRVFAEREKLASTGIGSGVAVPHGRLRLERPRMALAISRQGVAFDSADGEPARILVALLTPSSHPADQLKMIARVSRVLRDEAIRARLLDAGSSHAALRIMVEEDLRQSSAPTS